MKLIITLVSLAVGITVALATEAPDVPLGLTDFGRSEAHLRVQSTSPDFTSISLDQPAVVVSDQMIDFDTYNSFTIPGEPWQWDEGCPAVPQVTRFYRIPNTGSVDLIVTDEEFDLVEGVNPLPVQDEIPAFGQLARNTSVYTRDAWYPPHIAEVSSPVVLRDFRVVTVTLHPVQVNPVTHQARIYRRLSANLVANDRPGENELLNPGRPSGAWAEIYRSQIANLDESALDEMTTTPGTYLILTKNSSNARQWAESLFIWKTRKGFKVVINSQPSWSASTMITAIRSLYDASKATDTPLEHVCLIGDPQYSGGTDGVPTDLSGGYDHPFACATATDDVEDISVGRLSGSTLDQMAVINKKIMTYEREPFMDDTLWYHKGFFYAGVSSGVASNYPLMQWASQMFHAYTGVTNNTVLYHTPVQVDEPTVISQINGGVAFFLWRGGWIGGMQNTLAGQTNPGNRLPITLTITCSTGDFSYGLAVSESWLVAGSVAQPRGGICGIGTATAGTHPAPNYTLAGGLVYNICNLGVEHIGTCLVGAKLWLHLAFGLNSDYAINFSRWCNLMGDPGLSIWTDVPKVMNVTHPTVLNVGARQVAVQVTRASDSVAIGDALVVLWKRGTDSTWVKGLTDSNGRITLPVRVNDTGDMMLTVTKRNHKPYLFTIPCTAAGQMCTVSSLVLDDDNAGGTSGNSDGVVNPGEIIDLNTYLKNFGSATPAATVTAQLVSGSPRITVLQANATYPDLAPGDSALGSLPFRVQIAPDMQDRETALLLFTVNTTTAGQTQSAMQLSCVAGAIEYRSYQLVEGALNPGTTRTLRVTLHNKGSIELGGVTARLVSLSPFVQVDDASAVYGNMAVNADVTNFTDGFTVSSNSLTFRGHQASMLLITTAGGGHLDSAAFVLPVGTALSTDPTGPDSYGYYAYDNTDVSYELHPNFQYVNISQTGVGTNLNLADVGEQTTISQVWSTARRLPFPFKFYGQVYDSVTVCSNGWIAFGNQSWNPVFRNYPIPAMVAPEAMIAPYWDDLKTSDPGQGVWMHFNSDSHWVVFQWKASAGGSYGTPLDFEVILFDTAFFPTFDGNGLILVQYNTVSMNLPPGDVGSSDVTGCSIGIQAPRGLVGLAYAYQSSYASGAASVVNGRAIFFTTNTRWLFGNIAGNITDAQTGLPMAGVTVSVDGANNDDDTDSTGYYFIENVLVGSYSVSASKPRFNTAVVQNVVVELDSTEIVNFSLCHPEIALSTERMIASVTDQPLDTSFSIRNAGNGPLDYAISIRYAGDENPNPWDSISAIPVSALTGDLQITGCEFVGSEWWVTGGGAGGQNRFYRFSRSGEFLGSLPQPSITPIGWFDLACDNQYVYGSEDENLVGVDHQGMVQTIIPSPLNPARAVAYDPASDHFWVTDYTQDFYEIDRQGAIIRQIPNSGSGELSVTGLAWYAQDANGFKLYIFSQNGVGTLTRISRLNPVSQAQEFVVDLPGLAGDLAGGCAITPGWNSTLVVFGGVFQSPGGDRLQIHEVTFNTTWIDVAPMTFEVPGGGTSDVALHFDPITLLPDTNRVNLHIRSTVLDTVLILPVELTVISSSVAEPAPGSVPAVFALHQNYPNPFNPNTEIKFDLPEAVRVQIKIYNALGQDVATLIDEVRPAGAHRVIWDGKSASGVQVSSGVYVYQIKAGGFVDSKKMVLIR